MADRNVDMFDFQADTEIFLIKLIAMSSDSLDKIRDLSVMDKTVLDSQPEMFIHVQPDRRNNSLTIIDSGIGMTKAEKTWMDDIVRIGCCVCIRIAWGATPGEVHHMLDEANRKMGHDKTICLCPSHHRANLNNAHVVSRHHWRREFENRYGKEAGLLEWTKQAVARMREATV